LRALRETRREEMCVPGFEEVPLPDFYRHPDGSTQPRRPRRGTARSSTRKQEDGYRAQPAFAIFKLLGTHNNFFAIDHVAWAEHDLISDIQTFNDLDALFRAAAGSYTRL